MRRRGEAVTRGGGHSSGLGPTGRLRPTSGPLTNSPICKGIVIFPARGVQTCVPDTGVRCPVTLEAGRRIDPRRGRSPRTAVLLTRSASGLAVTVLPSRGALPPVRGRDPYHRRGGPARRRRGTTPGLARRLRADRPASYTCPLLSSTRRDSALTTAFSLWAAPGVSAPRTCSSALDLTRLARWRDEGGPRRRMRRRRRPCCCVRRPLRLPRVGWAAP